MRADGRAVSDRNEVSKLGALTDAGLAHGGPFDDAVSAQFHVIFDDDNAMLGNLVVRSGVRGISEAIIANDGAGVQRDAIAQDAVFVHDDVREEHAVVTDGGVWPDPNPRVEVAASADRGTPLDDGEWMDTGLLTNDCRLVDDGSAAPPRAMVIDRFGVNAGAQQRYDGISEREVGIVTGQGGQALWAVDARADQNSARGGGFKMAAIPGV